MLGFVTKSLSKIFGNKSERDIKLVLPIVDNIHLEFAKLQGISNDELRQNTLILKEKIKEYIKETQDNITIKQKQVDDNPDLELNEKEIIYKAIDQLKKDKDNKLEEILNQILPTAFAIIKETAKRFFENTTLEVNAADFDKTLATRKSNVVIEGEKAIFHNSWIAAGNKITWNMIHYDVQLIGGIVLHQGKVTEMATGEGKTLVATLPAYLNALSGEGVHIVTVNDYLARRDCEWMGPIFEFHGLKVDCIDLHEPHSQQRKNAYLADIIYGTNNEFGFDYLRDNMCRNPEELVQRKLHYAMVDEVDSVLIDEARTPLIISGPVPRGDQHEFGDLKPRVEKLVNAQRNFATTALQDAKKKIADGKKGHQDGGMSLLRVFRGLPKHKALIKYLSEEGIKSTLLSAENYYMQDQSKEMPKVDEELFFVIDEKHNSIELTDKGIDLITSSGEDPHFFIMPDVGSEVAEIEKSNLPDKEKFTKKEHLMRDFAIKSERIHSINQLLKAYTLFEKDVDYILSDGKVKIVDEQTGRVLDGRRYSDGLHQAIEAKENVKIEAATQTFATITLQNYFRMYHKLAGMTGTAETEAGELWEIYKLDVVVIPSNKTIVRKDMEDFVYKTKREKYNSVIEEIVNLTKNNRPVLVGTTSVESSELLSRMLKLRGLKHNVLNAKLHKSEADIIAEAGIASKVTIATNMAGRGTDIKLGPGVKDAGGLAIIGTERHEARRIDRQLRGRSGRQGDPGASQFYVSLEDDLMRMFGSDRIAKIMDRLGLKEGEVIQHSMITKSIERAQKKVEENNFGVRKRLLEYDDVMNSQRTVIYTKRKHALFGERLMLDITNMIYDVCEDTIDGFQSQSDYDGFKLDIVRLFAYEAPIEKNEFLNEKLSVLTDKLHHKLMLYYKEKTKAIAERAFPVIKEVFETKAAVIEYIVVPFSDGIKTINIPVNLKKAYETNAREVVSEFEKFISLLFIDERWKEHLREMDDLRQSVQGAVYEQKDPLLVYKYESFKLFKNMLNSVNKEVASFLLKGDIPVQNPENVRAGNAPKKTDLSHMRTSKAEVISNKTSGNGNANKNEVQKVQPVRVEAKTGRNEPCPCGSGKKYKHCHGR